MYIIRFVYPISNFSSDELVCQVSSIGRLIGCGCLGKAAAIDLALELRSRCLDTCNRLEHTAFRGLLTPHLSQRILSFNSHNLSGSLGFLLIRWPPSHLCVVLDTVSTSAHSFCNAPFLHDSRSTRSGDLGHIYKEGLDYWLELSDHG